MVQLLYVAFTLLGLLLLVTGLLLRTVEWRQPRLRQKRSSTRFLVAGVL